MALTPDDERLLKEIYQRLADRPLEPNDPLYEEVYNRPDGEDPVAKLRTHIEFALVESLQLFSGFRGMGKTTELFRLRRELKDRGFLVLYANALDYLSPSDEIDITTMLMSVAGAFGEEMEKVDGVKSTGESFWRRITNYLTKTNVDATDVSFKLPAGVELKAALKTAPSFRQKLESFLADRLSELKAEVNAFVEEGVRRIRRDLNRPDLNIVFLFDQLEQLRGSWSNEQSVIQSVERLFASHLDQIKLPYLHVIYTVPPWLQFVRPGAFSIKTLPCLRLWKNDQERSPYDSGFDRMREAIMKRFTPEGFRRIFGDESASEPGADKLIEMSGGHFRDLLRLFQEAIVLIRTWRPSLPVAPEVLDRAIINMRNEYLPISIEDAHWLDKIAKLRDVALTNTTSTNVGRLSRFLDTHIVLYLKNGEDWYDIHPLIRDKVATLAQLPVEEAQNGSGS